MDTAQSLRSFPFLEGIPLEMLGAASPLFHPLELRPGAVLWRQGAAVDKMVLVLGGLLLVEVDGVEVAQIGEGELAGEASIFSTDAARSATMTAQIGTQVLTLSRAALLTLRAEAAPVYDALLEQALLTLAQRVRVTDLRLSQLTDGDRDVPQREQTGLLVRLWRSLSPGGPTTKCPPLEPLLRRHPTLAGAPTEVLTTLSWAFGARPVASGEILFLEGEAGDGSYIVAEGEVEVLRNVRGERAELLARLSPGDHFGMNALLQSGTRTASCVAASPGWVYHMDLEAYGEMTGTARRVWQEVMVASLASQIRNANLLLHRAMERSGPGGPADKELPTLLEAYGHLQVVSLDRRE